MVSVTGVNEWTGGELRSLSDCLAGEEPLEIRIGEVPFTVTMRTPGHDQDLALGLLLTEGVITDRAQVAAIGCEGGAGRNRANRLRVDLAHGVAFDPESLRRNFQAVSSCGICGKASIDQLRARRIKRPRSSCLVDPAALSGMTARLREAQHIFDRTGAVHAAGLFSAAGDLLAVREDVGRHNAVDKAVGWALANDRIPLGDAVLVVSGRSSFEIVQKALVAGIPVLASVSAASDLAVQLAREFGQTCIGFLQKSRFVVYSGAERLAAPALQSASCR